MVQLRKCIESKNNFKSSNPLSIKKDYCTNGKCLESKHNFRMF